VDGPWRAEVIALVRAASGGLLFGVPLLYTMEVWWTGSHTTPRQMLAVLALLSIPVLALNKTTGFRKSRDVRTRDAVADTVEALAVGIVVTAVVLVLLQEISPDTGLRSGLGKIIYEAVPFCLGVGVARHFLHGGRAAPDDSDGAARDGDGDGGGDDDDETALHPTLSDLGATVLGATFISLSIAPTDEVPMIASAMSPQWLLALVAVTLLTSYAIVFAADFHGQEGRHTQQGAFQRPITETLVSYLVSLVVAGLLLWLFQRGIRPSADLITRVVVLGFPAAVGGAAGRLAV
jgi:putative integral membrane protein (TIGR02587 family)